VLRTKRPSHGSAARPAPVDEDPDRNLFFLDINGDGVIDQVRIGNGFMEYWPHSGEGHFGERVTMEGATTFAPDGEFDPARLRFADLHGTGTPDVLYLGQGKSAGGSTPAATAYSKYGALQTCHSQPGYSNASHAPAEGRQRDQSGQPGGVEERSAALKTASPRGRAPPMTT
jgi:hypothetical protein